jgi:hypothetical protein
VNGVIITTNYKTDGLYLPANDRRHYVAWSELTSGDFLENYWNDLWQWYEYRGIGHVAAYLAQIDLSKFDPKAPPRKTAAFWAITDANRAPENAELADVLDRMGNPAAVTLEQIKTAALGVPLGTWLAERNNRRRIPHRMQECNYTPVRNGDAEDGLWKIGGRRQVVYTLSDLAPRDRLAAAEALGK